MENIGIYISVPFCRSKCSYCNFASGVFPAAYHARYIERVIADLRAARQQAAQIGALLPECADSVYLGGGTPSVLAPELLRKLFTALRDEFHLTDNSEITIECAPGQIADDFLSAMADCRVDRVSFGVQSFIDREAAVTGRLHTREVALSDIDRVRNAGIRSVNVDLIAGLPHQTRESWAESLDVLVESAVDHASIYMLEVDEDSRLGQELIGGGGRYHAAAVPPDDAVAEMYTQAIMRLADAGLPQYEISNFARAGAESRHNCKYWKRQPYIGFGLDAHSMLNTASGGAVRFQTGEALQDFLDRPGWAQVHVLTPSQQLEEAWFVGLRLNDGVSPAALRDEFGQDAFVSCGEVLDDLLRSELLERVGDRVRLTARGRLMSNDVFTQFLSDTRIRHEELVLVD